MNIFFFFFQGESQGRNKESRALINNMEAEREWQSFWLTVNSGNVSIVIVSTEVPCVGGMGGGGQRQQVPAAQVWVSRGVSTWKASYSHDSFCSILAVLCSLPSLPKSVFSAFLPNVWPLALLRIIFLFHWIRLVFFICCQECWNILWK